MSKPRVIIRDAVQFTLGGYISSICNFISAVIVRRILDPFFMGVYSQLLLIFEYAKYNHLGIINALDRQIPYYNGRKEFEKSEEIKNTGISFSLFMSLCCASLIIFCSYFFKDRISSSVLMGLKVVAVMVIIQSLTSFYVTLVRTHHLFGALSKYVILVAICDIFFKVLLGLKFGIMGILWTTFFTLTIGMVYLYKRCGLRFRIIFKIPKRVIKLLLGIGFPLLLAGFTFMALRSIDRIMIIALLSKEDLGYYSIATMMHSFVFQLPTLIYTVLFPRFYEAFGNSEHQIDKLKGYLEKPTLMFAYFFPVLIGIVVIILPVFTKYVLPKYMQGVTPASILLFGTVFISVTNMSSYLLIALKKQKTLVFIGAICVIISAVLNLAFVKVFHLGIKGVALGTAIIYFLYSLLLIGYAIKYYMKNLYSKIKFFVNIYGPLLWVLVIFCLFNFVFRYSFDRLESDIRDAFLQITAFLILTLPLLIYANKKIDLYNKVKNAGFNFFKK